MRLLLSEPYSYHLVIATEREMQRFYTNIFCTFWINEQNAITFFAYWFSDCDMNINSTNSKVLFVIKWLYPLLLLCQLV